MTATEQLNPETIISTVADWKGRDVRCEPLGGGITNHNYIIHVGGSPAHPDAEKYVLRLPGEGTGLFIDRGHERACTIAASEAGVAPKVAHAVGDALILAFVEGETLHPHAVAGHPQRIRQVVETVRRVHQHATFPNKTSVFDMIRRYTARAREVEAPFPPDLKQMYAIADRIEAAMARDELAPVASHNDLLPENFLVDKAGRLWIIDWEYAGMSDPFFDLGDFCTEHPFTTAEEELVLTTYCGEMLEHRYYRMLLYKLTADLWWSIWAMIQTKLSTIDFDFFEYGMNRVRRFYANASHPDCERWFAGV